MARRITSPELVGRGELLAALVSTLERARSGEPTISLVVGEAGIGKSRLVREYVRHTAADDFLILVGGCLALEAGEYPYLPVVSALRDLPAGLRADISGELSVNERADLARVLPGFGPESVPTSGYAPARMHELLLGLLCRVSRRRCIALVLEDMHWADPSTRDFLVFLSRNLTNERLALVATYRDDLEDRHPLRPIIGELVRHERVARHGLEPLSAADTELLLAGILDATPDPVLAAAIHDRSGGNPFFAEELAAASGSGDLPATIRDAVLGRCAGLPAEAQDVIKLAAAIDRPAPDDLLGAAGLVEPALSRAIRAGVAAHLLTVESSSGAIAFRHAIVRDAVYADLLPGERRRLHAVIARTLVKDRDGAHPAELAHHWSAAGDDPAALAAAVEAGRAACRVYASGEAAEHFGRALSLWNRVEPERRPQIDRVELFQQVAEATRAVGDVDRAVAYCDEALAELDGDADPIRAAWFHERMGRYRAWDLEFSLDHYAQALALLPPGSPERARLLGNEGLTLMLMVRWHEARARCEKALVVARAVGDRAAEGFALSTLGLVSAYLGDPDEGERQLSTAVMLVEAHGQPEDCARAYLHLAETKRLRGDYDGAAEVTRMGIATARRLGAEGAFGHFMAINLAEDLFVLGRWDETAAVLTELDAQPLVVTAEVFRDTLAGQLAVAQGRFDDAERRFAAAQDRVEPGIPSELLPSLGAGRAELALWRRDGAVARAVVRETLAAVGDGAECLYTPSLYAMGIRVEADLADAAGHVGGVRLADAREEAESLFVNFTALLASGSGSLPPIAGAYRTLAEAELGRARGAGDPEQWVRCAREWQQLGHPLSTAYARMREAEARLASSGDRAAATASLAEAQRVTQRLGASALHDEIEALARRARLRIGDEAPATVRTEPDRLGLTSREVEVLRLVADGLSNRQIGERLFISEKTAGVHVSRILSKLNVPSRVHAAGVAHRAGLFDGQLTAD